MTAKERQHVQRLEIKNRELLAEIERQQEAYRKTVYELVDLKARLELVESALRNDPW